jgi:hypothetical protein
VATVLGVAAYTLWLTLYLLFGRAGPAQGAFLWLLAPIVTALGFSAGIAIRGRPWEGEGVPLARTLGWPLAGCATGAVVAAVFGPMLIAFMMLVGGAVAVVLLVTREAR